MSAIFSKTKQGFTLIELMIVITIVGTLSSIILTNLNEGRVKAQYAVVAQELRTIQNAIMTAGNGTESLMAITLQNCSDCDCRGIDVRNIADVSPTHVCLVRLQPAFNRIATASSLLESLEPIRFDPWNSPYMIDENELEQVGNPCVPDTMRSVGADGRFGTADDYVIVLPFRTPTCRQ
jgi:prepilin-type N-terminal cleavage/methylation domain-containing protein